MTQHVLINKLKYLKSWQHVLAAFNTSAYI